MRYLNTVYVRNHRARVQHRRGSLLVSSPEGSQRVPLEAVDALIVLGGAQITTQALDACVRRGVRVAALQMSGAIRFVVSGPTSGNVHLRTAQFETVTDDARSLDVARGGGSGQAPEQQHGRPSMVAGREGPCPRRKSSPPEASRSGSASLGWRKRRLATTYEASRGMRPGSTFAQSLRPCRQASSSSRGGRAGRPGIPSMPCSASATGCS